MDELGAFLKEFSLVECAPYLPQGLTLAQLLAMTSLPPALVQEKPKLVKTLNKAIQKYKKSGRKPTQQPKATPSPSASLTVKPIIVAGSSSDPQRASISNQTRDEPQEPLPPLPFDQDPTPGDFENLIRVGRETNKRIADSWRLAFEGGHKSVDDEEYLITTDLVASTLACLANTPTTAIPEFNLFYSKLRQFCELQQEYETNVIRPDQLKSFQTSRSKRRKVSRLNSRVHMEIKWVLAASGVTNRASESLAIRKRSLSRINVREGQALWETHFLDLDMDMVPWDRFLGAFTMHTKQSVDMHDEILLKHILDNDNLGTVTPKQFSSFLKCFGPLDKALENVKNLYKQKWFHDFLSVEEVHRLLTDQPPGTFLVRFSRSHSNSFALEYVAGKVQTVLVRCDLPLGVYIKEENNVEKMFPNLDSLIKHYSDILKIPFQSDIVIQPWFVGDVSTADAEDMLHARPPGTFMVRFAASGRFQYACSYSTLNGVKHTMIQKVPNGYVIEETRASSSESSSSSSPTPSQSGDASSPSTPTPLSWAPASTPTVYPSLQAFLKVWKSELKYNYDPDNVPELPVMEFMEADRYVNLSGPGDGDGRGGDAEFSSRIYAQTIASYPKTCLGWDVVCDQWYVRLLGNRIVFALADGCGWGPKARLAAQVACRAIIDQVGDRDVQARIRDTMECRHYLLRSFSVAHELVVAATTGTTTLLAGILMEVDPDTDEWALVTASVGDCKCLVYVHEADKCLDVTLGNRRNLRDARDPGGRLGDSDGHKQPDLRNLQSYFWPLKRNDILMLVSDGVHDNLDPESWGKQPSELAADFAVTDPRLSQQALAIKDWDDADQDTTEKLKSTWMLQKLHSVIKAKELLPKSLTHSLVDFAMQTTSPSRTFMEAHPDKPEPNDHVAYPGKMDHTTCISVSIGPFFKDVVSWRNRANRAASIGSLSSAGAAAPSNALNGSSNSVGNANANNGVAKKSAIVTEDVRSEARRFQQAQPSGGFGNRPNRPTSPTNFPPPATQSSAAASSSSQGNTLTQSSSAIARATSTPVLTPLPSTPTLFQPDPPKESNSLNSASSQWALPSTLISAHIQNMFPAFPYVSLSPFSSDYSLQMGNASSGDCELSCSSLAAGRSISTYPVDTSAHGNQSSVKKRIGDPNTTNFCLDATPNRITFAVSAGATWGAAAADCSYRACHAFFHQVRESQLDLDNSRDAAVACVKAFDKCQQTISEVSTEAQSTVVLLAGMLVATPQERRWLSIFTTLGNNKAFVWRHATRTIVDLTHHKQGSDRRHPGGFMSADPLNNPPVLTNLCVSFGDLDVDDFVIVMTPGTYVNFDPELLGLSPKADVIQPPLKEDDWNLDSNEHIAARSHYRCRAIEQLLATVEQGDDLPKKFANAIIEYCKKTTAAARSFMEANPTASEPRDRIKYPGKMGHALCLVIRAAKLSSQEVSAAASENKRRDLLSTQSRPMKA